MTGDAILGQRSGRILLVDDDAAVRHVLERFLAQAGHSVATAASVDEAIGWLGREAFDLVLTDLNMPGSSGLDLLASVRSKWPTTRTMLMSGGAEAAHAAAAIEYGVDRLFLKPFHMDELNAAVEKTLLERSALIQQAEDRLYLEDMARRRETESRTWILRAAHALAAAVEAKDAYTAGHAKRVTAYGLELARTIGGVDLARFEIAGDLHDVGKIGVPDRVLNKADRLTEEEFAYIRRHPEAGERILQPFIDDELVLSVVRSHHERWDGLGYPDGMRALAIPLPARILAAADTLDAMTSDRAYRSGLSWDVAIDQILGASGTQFDPAVVEALEQTIDRLEPLYISFHTDRLST